MSNTREPAADAGHAPRVAVAAMPGNPARPYPEAPFHPGAAYPEYPFATVAPDANDVYGAVRRLLRSLDLDAGNFGRKEWNPLGAIVRPGDTVLIKPNFVSDRRHRKDTDPENDWRVLTTHPSVIRPLVDYAPAGQRYGRRRGFRNRL